jgi:hypothetical protein
MLRFRWTCWVITAIWLGAFAGPRPAQALFAPDSVFLFEGFHTIPGTTITPDFSSFQTIPIPSPFVVQETNIFASSPPVDEPGGAFERNEYLARFKKSGEPSANNFGHQFQRSEAWDFAFDFSIQSSHPEVRKEAGLYFESQQLGNAIFNVASNDTFYGSGPGNIGVIFAPMIPAFNFTTIPGPLGDYNHDLTVNAADYTIWRNTLGIMDDGVDPAEDMRANGNNDGASENTIDQADYDVWKMNFGQTVPDDSVAYTTGDTIRIRLIYTPPELDADIPFNAADPAANVTTPATMEYQIVPQGGPMATSGPLPFTSSWLGLPNNTLIGARVQNLSTASVAPDDSTVTFANFDFNGDLPGSGMGSGIGGIAGVVPEPCTTVLLGIALGMIAMGRRRR